LRRGNQVNNEDVAKRGILAEDLMNKLVPEDGNTQYASSYDEDIAAADPKAVLGKKRSILAEDLMNKLVPEDGNTQYASSYDEDIAAADPKEVLGERNN
jgi:hypothetical protein